MLDVHISTSGRGLGYGRVAKIAPACAKEGVELWEREVHEEGRCHAEVEVRHLSQQSATRQLEGLTRGALMPFGGCPSGLAGSAWLCVGQAIRVVV